MHSMYAIDQSWICAFFLLINKIFSSLNRIIDVAREMKEDI